ncbi:MAG: hypothetical protein ACM3Q2_09970, partial [Syntrophothermus sp.]
MSISINKNIHIKNTRHNFVSALLLFASAVMIPFTASEAQWNSNPLANKMLVTGVKNPIGISTVPDQTGGGFIFWEDKIDSVTTDIFFQHFNEDGQISFRADGKQISRRKSSRTSAIASAAPAQSAVVVYHDIDNDKSGELFAQRVSSRGDLLWDEDGVRLTDHQGETEYPAISSDRDGNAFVTYIYRDFNTPVNYNIYLQKIKPSGSLVFRGNGVLVNQSPRVKSHSKITSDNKGGAYVLWVESSEGKARLYAAHFDSTGKNTWSGKNILISSGNDNVLGFSAAQCTGGQIYISWEVKKGDKDIYHQLLSIDGRPQWSRDGEKISSRNGNQTSPQFVCTDSTIIVSWVNELFNDRDIYIQKFSLKGKPLWGKDGIPVIKFWGNQMSQRLIADRNAGVIIAWIDMRSKSHKGTIFAQRVSSEGRQMWDSTGVEIAANINSDKSYLSLLPNKINGAVAVFRENRLKESNIYGQRIFGNGKFNSDILGFRAVLNNDMVRASWETLNESYNKGFYVERITSDTVWQQIKFIPGRNSKGPNQYEFSEKMPVKGTV